ncbi:hypothetical protein B0J13DRAFT_333281 [Dactylonectria estremocensis]|uniref:Uncharacterized protein n=1 Tax=Dactylonectria estremocensis TaxID=1079267 RepID=A0A9P9CXF6_9HYPO|nr:hypothetical protein B0J13DRAFT_333281 [Dactylonectria estremocensis]
MNSAEVNLNFKLHTWSLRNLPNANQMWPIYNILLIIWYSLAQGHLFDCHYTEKPLMHASPAMVSQRPNLSATWIPPILRLHLYCMSLSSMLALLGGAWVLSAVGAEYGGWGLIWNGVLQRRCLLFGVALSTGRGNNVFRLQGHFLISTAIQYEDLIGVKSVVRVIDLHLAVLRCSHGPRRRVRLF